MANKEITLKFSLETGEVIIEAHGFKGKSCVDATKFLKQALGEMSDFQAKSEWYESNMELNQGLMINSNLCG